MRQYFDGYRFPVVSYYHTNHPTENHNKVNTSVGADNDSDEEIVKKNKINIKRTHGATSVSVRLLRSGQFHASLPLDSFLNSYITKPVAGSMRSRRFRLLRVVRIRLHETDMDTIRTSPDSFLPIEAEPTGQVSGLMSQLCLDDSVSLPTGSSSTPGSTSRTSWYIPLTLGPPTASGSASFTGTVIVLTGPGSGRTWQPLLTSLTQASYHHYRIVAGSSSSPFFAHFCRGLYVFSVYIDLLILCPATRTLSGFEDLIEREWVRYGYPFAPDPPDWHDSSVVEDYDAGATFALFLDCVHQMLYQYPTEFAFTECTNA
ncbi:unnamed protein product [Echinostoma caproni]|uniref:Myotubularin phosphatase domain-containing protein n=1 Tax=Echinostoma caproni TaxID=27848 RepID=A0A183B305_9TREM|nr:unnamed protein product [Echinostoma caproni]